MKDIIYQDMLDQINADTEFADIKSMVRYLIKHQMISSREGALVLQATNSAYLGMTAPERVNMLKALFVTLAEFS